MFTVFNIAIILIVLLIAYWWANQGIFSALLHLVAVTAAGALAFAVWEPLTVGFLLKGGAFDRYAWGVSLIGVFGVGLLVFRVLLDKLVPGNVDMPQWSNLTFGMLIGIGSGIITCGVCLIGVGHLQSHKEIVGWQGYGRSSTSGTIGQDDPLWLPVHSLTATLYETLSVGSFLTPRPMAHWAPELDHQTSLIRDSFGGGNGLISLAPDAASIDFCGLSADGRCLVVVTFEQKAIDYNEQLTLSSSQIRLISDASGFESPEVIHPEGFTNDKGQTFEFSTATSYLTSEGARQQTKAMLQFKLPNTSFEPRFLMIRGTRFALSPTKGAPPAEVMAFSNLESIPSGGTDITDSIEVANHIRPVSVTANSLPGTLAHVENYLTRGDGTFGNNSGGRGGKLAIKGIYAPKGQVIVQVSVGQQASASLSARSIRENVSEEDTIKLVDADGFPYTPIGYIHLKADRTTRLVLDPVGRREVISQIPNVSGSEEVRLIFSVNEGVTISGLKVGDIDVGSCNILAVDSKR